MKNLKHVFAGSTLALILIAMGQVVTVKASEVEPAVETGTVVVHYMDEYANPLAGQATGSQETEVTAAGVLDENQVPVGTPYDTSEHKPTTITTEAGKTFYLIDYEYTNGLLEVSGGVNTRDAAEKGTVTAGTTFVTYVYSATKRENHQNNQWDVPTTEPTQPSQPVEPVQPAQSSQEPAVKKEKLRIPAGNNGVKTRVPVKKNQTPKPAVKKVRVPANNNGAKTRVPVKKNVQKPVVPNNQL